MIDNWQHQWENTPAPNKNTKIPKQKCKKYESNIKHEMEIIAKWWCSHQCKWPTRHQLRSNMKKSLEEVKGTTAQEGKRSKAKGTTAQDKSKQMRRQTIQSERHNCPGKQSTMRMQENIAPNTNCRKHAWPPPKHLYTKGIRLCPGTHAPESVRAWASAPWSRVWGSLRNVKVGS